MAADTHTNDANGGTHTNGMTTNGMTTNGMTTNGMTTNGMTTNGMTTNGMATNGMTTNGMTTNGMTTNGMTTNGMTTNGNTDLEKGRRQHNLEKVRARGSAFANRLKFRRDYRKSLPPYISRFTGFRSIDENPPYEPLPIPPFTWLKKIPLEVGIWLFAWVGAFIGILLIEVIMSSSTAFRDVCHSPTIITSFGASAVLLFGVIESPLAQPRNFVLGQFISAFMGTWITRLFVLDPKYHGNLVNTRFHPNTFINGGVSMASSLLAMLVTGTAHPPAGATGLNAAVESAVVTLSWRYLPVVLASSLIMLGWALIINNLGRRRYPMHWWAPGTCFVREADTEPEQEEQAAVDEARVRRESREEGMLRRESVESTSGAIEAEEPEGRSGEGYLNEEPAALEDAVQTMETPAMEG